jgi:hypothetical protein
MRRTLSYVTAMSKSHHYQEPPNGGLDQLVVQPWWLRGGFDPAEQEPDECTRCGCSMAIRDGREPQDDPELNVCDPCAQDLVAEMWSRLNASDEGNWTASEKLRSGSHQRVGRRLTVERMTDLQISKWWAFGWAGASGKHAAMNMRGETTGRKLKRIERRMRVAVKRREAVERSQPPTIRLRRPMGPSDK